ncbi:MAG: alpha-amylase family glycosyl hydrolase [Eubacterium sp.]|nr:alpha-amylase family glycosyl hydrolase [Eubacterium sp.]
MPAWLKDAVFYEIYPQSFCDTNADGIGDINGIIGKLDYIKELGCNALWINPIYDSPFKDAGYDVRDYRKVAPRYGTNTDLYRLFGEAHNRGIRVLLDLVPGHTSEEHPWFLESKKDERNEYSDRYIWTNSAFQGIRDHLYIGGESERDAVYMLNFFKCQPALNYGWLNRTEEWQTGVDDPAAIATREAMKDIMRFWLDHGCDGFRVDMADSLVKEDDENKSATQAIWRSVREMLDRDYPEAAIVSEWSNPLQAIPGGFHCDFYLDHHYNGYNTLLRDYETEGGDHSYFLCDAGGDINRFLDDYMPKYSATKGRGYISMFTCNHDTLRPARNLSPAELKLAYAFIFTMPGVPFLYYGDELGQKYLDVKTKEGGYARTGSRTPMQWTNGRNAGFSEAPADILYLPVDPSPDAPSVESEKDLPESLFNVTKALIALRHDCVDLQADADFEPLLAEKDEPFVYRRGRLVLAVNPSSKEKALPPELTEGKNVLYRIGKADAERIGAQAFVVFA